MKVFDRSKIKTVEMIFENCESVTIPIECFKELDIYTDKNGFFNFNCHIIDNGSIYYYDIGYRISPCQRLNRYDDITSLRIIDINGYSHCGSVLWDDYDHQYNSMQTSDIVSYKEIKVRVERGNRKYTLQEVLTELKDGVIVIDNNGNEYRVYEEDGDTYLFDTIVSVALLKQSFTIKVK